MNQKKEETDWWDELTLEQQEELLLAIEESEDEANLVTNEEAQALIQSWLKNKTEYIWERRKNPLD